MCTPLSRFRRTTGAMTLAVVIVLTVAACGDDGDDAADPAGLTSEPTSASATEGAETSADPDRPDGTAGTAGTDAEGSGTVATGDAAAAGDRTAKESLSDDGYPVIEPVAGSPALWADTIDGTGCEGGPAWGLFAQAPGSTGWVAATETVFASAPTAWSSESARLTVVASCEEQSWDVRSADVDADTGMLVDERVLRPGDHDDWPIQQVFYDDALDQVVFQLADDRGTSQIVRVDPIDGSARPAFVLGDPAVGCSAGGREPVAVDDPSLTVSARETRDDLVRSAVACDFAALGAMTGDDFVYAIDDPTQMGPAGWWARSEHVFGDPVLDWLVDLLSRPGTPTLVDGEEAFVWPAAAVLTPADLADSRQAQDELAAMGYSTDEIERLIAGDPYVGWRTGIAADGRWLFHLAGD